MKNTIQNITINLENINVLVSPDVYELDIDRPKRRKRMDLTGEVYGRLTVISEAEQKGSIRCWNVMCECGNTTVVRQLHLRSGNTSSCGCYFVEVHTTHGDSGTKLYKAWDCMITRCKQRTESGEVCNNEFESYEHFKEWALSEGWVEGMVICRKGDVGNYSPTNAYVGTHQQNMEEAHAKSFAVLSPDGRVIDGFNLAKFCRGNGLNETSMWRVLSGHQESHQGYKKACLIPKMIH